MVSVVVREMRPGDELNLIALGKMMHEESPIYRDLPFDVMKLKNLSSFIYESDLVRCLVAEKENKLIGMYIASVAPYWFSSSIMMIDTVLYVHPFHRGSSAVPRMLRKMREWGKSMGAIKSSVGVSSGIDTERTVCFFEKLGYDKAAILMQKDI